MTKKVALAVLGLMAGTLVAAPLARAAAYRDDANHFSFTPPEGWMEVPREFTEAKNSLLARQGAPVRFATGFQVAGETLGDLPSIWIQIEKSHYSGKSYNEIDREVAAILKENLEKFGAPNSKIERAAFDRAKNQYSAHLSLNLPVFGEVDEVTITTIGAESTVLLHCSCPHRDFEPYLKIFQAAGDTIEFDPAFRFVAPSEFRVWLGRNWSWVVGYVGGGLALAGFAWYYRRRSARLAQTTDSPVPSSAGPTVSVPQPTAEKTLP